MFGLNSGFCTSQEVFLQSLVFKSLYHNKNVTYNVTGYKWKFRDVQPGLLYPNWQSDEGLATLHIYVSTVKVASGAGEQRHDL